MFVFFIYIFFHCDDDESKIWRQWFLSFSYICVAFFNNKATHILHTQKKHLIYTTTTTTTTTHTNIYYSTLHKNYIIILYWVKRCHLNFFGWRLWEASGTSDFQPGPRRLAQNHLQYSNQSRHLHMDYVCHDLHESEGSKATLKSCRTSLKIVFRSIACQESSNFNSHRILYFDSVSQADNLSTWWKDYWGGERERVEIKRESLINHVIFIVWFKQQ